MVNRNQNNQTPGGHGETQQFFKREDKLVRQMERETAQDKTPKQ